jgi:uncharacterized protein YndB with AHSA1/START domain
MAKQTLTAEPGSHEIVMTREFDAPREMIFRAMTEPELVARWWGPRSLTTEVDQLDARMGGIWRFVHRDEEGNEYAFRGVYHQVDAPARLVYTFEWEGMPGHILLETITLEERDGKTLVTDASVFQSVADRDGMLQSGMEGGATESWDRLEDLLAERQR